MLKRKLSNVQNAATELFVVPEVTQLHMIETVRSLLWYKKYKHPFTQKITALSLASKRLKQISVTFFNVKLQYILNKLLMSCILQKTHFQVWASPFCSRKAIKRHVLQEMVLYLFSALKKSRKIFKTSFFLKYFGFHDGSCPHSAVSVSGGVNSEYNLLALH